MMARIKLLKMFLILLILFTMLGFVPLALAAPPAQIGRPVAIINTSNLNQRTGPGIQYAVQGTHPGGTVLPVIGRNVSASWWEVESDFGSGWVNGEFVLTRGNFTGVPVVTEFGLLGRPNAVVPGLPIPVYALPNPGSYVLGLAPGEAQFPIFGQKLHTTSETWYWLIRTDLGLAWVPQDSVALAGDATTIPVVDDAVAAQFTVAPISPTGVVHAPQLLPVPSAPVVEPPVIVPVSEPPPPPIVAAPSTSAEATTTPPTSTSSTNGQPQTTVITTSTEETSGSVSVTVNTQITVSIDGSSDDGLSEAQTATNNAGSSRWIAQVIVTTTDLRRSPDGDAEAISLLPIGLEMFVNGESDNGSHFLVEVPGFPLGWVAKEAVRLRPSGATHTVVIVEGHQVELRAEANTGADVVSILAVEHEATMLGIADGWFLVNAHPGEGWLPVEAVRIRDDSISDLTVGGSNALSQAAQ